MSGLKPQFGRFLFFGSYEDVRANAPFWLFWDCGSTKMSGLTPLLVILGFRVYEDAGANDLFLAMRDFRFQGDVKDKTLLRNCLANRLNLGWLEIRRRKVFIGALALKSS